MVPRTSVFVCPNTDKYVLHVDTLLVSKKSDSASVQNRKLADRVACFFNREVFPIEPVLHQAYVTLELSSSIIDASDETLTIKASLMGRVKSDEVI